MPFRGVGSRLALALLAAVAGVLGIVYIIVVPSYQGSLEQNALGTLERTLIAASQTFPRESFLQQGWVQQMRETRNVRALVFSYTPIPGSVAVTADSNTTTNDSALTDDPIALAAARRGRVARGIVERDGRRIAEAALPLDGGVIAFDSSIEEQLDTVDVVRRRVFIAGGFAVVFAGLLGYLGATMLARRIRRLEAAAERIAGGNFDEAVVDAGADELAQLARAFERMRLRLARLDRARGEFIANASHELRTPLFSLGGFLELLDDPELDTATREEFLTQMREQVERLTKLATELLDLSRIDAGRLAVYHEPVDLADVAAELAATFGPRAAATEHPLEVVADETVLASGDGERILQIGRALLENALVHTPPGTTVSVTAARDGGRAQLRVEDAGPGIPDDAQRNVFERFYRLDGRRASGSGLGLSIARELAELMGGRIELESRPGRTVFTLVIGVDVPEAAAAVFP